MNLQRFGSVFIPRRKRRFLGLVRLGIILALVLTFLPFIQTTAHATPTDTLTVDASGNLGSPSYRASGFLHPFNPDATQPADSLVTLLKPQVMRYAAGTSAPQGPEACTWATTPAYGQRINNLGIAHQQVSIADQWGFPACYPDGKITLPGDNGDFSVWDNLCHDLVLWEQGQGLNPEYDIWNEPIDDWTWGGRSLEQWLQTWKHCYQAIRAVNPNAVIVGPSTTNVPSWYRQFVQFARDNNVVPNYFTWHQFGQSGDPYAATTYVQTILAEEGVSYQGLIVNETNRNPHDVNDNSVGGLAWMLARFERAGVAGVAHTCLASCNQGNLSGALINGQPTGGWWLYQRYAAITDHLLPVTAGTYLDGVAGADPSTQQMRVLVGTNDQTGSMQVNLTNLNSTPYVINNGQTYVTVEVIPKTNSLSAPIVVQSGYVNVSNNAVNITLNWNNANDAYNIILSPSAPPVSYGSYQASTGFSSRAGLNQWTYQYSTDGEQTFGNMSWDSGHNAWVGPSGYNDYCNIWSGSQHPGFSSCTSARVWMALSPGIVSLGSNGPITVATGCGHTNGVNIRVLKNQTQIWPASGWQNIPNGQSFTFPAGVTTSVNPGDLIRFIVAKEGSINYCDATGWDQTVSYMMTNNGFEAPGTTNYIYNPSGGTWTFNGSSGVSTNNRDFTSNNPNAPQGTQVAFLQGTGSMSQSIHLAAGNYTLSFQAAQRIGGSTTSGINSQDFRVLVDGQVVGTFQPSSSTYSSYSTNSFSVSAGTHTLVFEGLNSVGGDNTAFVDAITIT
jgi:hypothetical protein